MTRTELCAYAAGLFDGEGCVSIYPHTVRKGFAYRVKIGMSDPRAIKLLDMVWPGKWYAMEPGKGGRKRWFFIWYPADPDAFVSDILPYSVVKRPELEVFIRCRTDPNRTRSTIRWAVQRLKELKTYRYEDDLSLHTPG